ncbi:hypothetical protein AVEN_39221-1 [Araneus ventricosus]|uniref:Uncharacterized protein n=1 Tax=Araneus ventricosus TaxID=182803 RepID=A0A4Y2IAX2_ARAVE|nr:hypothetical protein AVEN_39221-1 [Araneus ventricosus]
MASPVQKAICVLKFNKCHSVITVQRFRQCYNQEPPNANNICRWHRMFEETGCLCKGKTSGRPHVSVENVERIRCTYERSPWTSTSEGSRELKKATKNGMACSQKEAENETIRNSICAAIETGRLRQMYELRYVYAGKHGG